MRYDFTEEQVEKIEKNHSLIWGFINDKQLTDDWYVIISESLMKAVRAHDDNKGKLSTFFFRIANNDYKSALRKKTEVLGIEDCISVQIYSEDSDNSNYTSSRGYLNIPSTDEIMGCLSEQEQKIAWMLFEGMTQAKISEEFQVSQQMIAKKVRKIREKVGGIL